jgi:hypothetical protein
MSLVTLRVRGENAAVGGQVDSTGAWRETPAAPAATAAAAAPIEALPSWERVAALAATAASELQSMRTSRAANPRLQHLVKMHHRVQAELRLRRDVVRATARLQELLHEMVAVADALDS